MLRSRRFLRQIADTGAGALVNRAVAQLDAVERDAAGIGGNQADNHVKTGGFARAVGAEQADYFAAGDVQRKIFDHAAFFKRFLQTGNVQNGRGR